MNFLGGTGFVGSSVISSLREKGFDVVSISRRGKIYEKSGENDGVTWLSADATNTKEIEKIVSTYGPFYACVHSIGLLLDSESGLSSLNKFVSGSSSIPSNDAKYDLITRKTAFNAIDSIKNYSNDSKRRVPFVFISAAEAGWTLKAPVPWLEKYLIAKRQVEAYLLSNNDFFRPVIMRPSLIWSPSRPQALVSVVPFYVGSALGLPFVDRPVILETLVKACVNSIIDDKIEGINRYEEIEKISALKR